MRQSFWALVLILSVAIADAVLKIWAIQTLPIDAEADLKPVFDLALHKNPGIAFDIPLPLVIVIPLTLLVCGFLAWTAYRAWGANRGLAIAALTIIIGALGNATDRLINGFTTDYLIFFKTSAINLSDVLILLGILGLLWYDRRIPTRHN